MPDVPVADEPSADLLDLVRSARQSVAAPNPADDGELTPELSQLIRSARRPARQEVIGAPEQLPPFEGPQPPVVGRTPTPDAEAAIPAALRSLGWPGKLAANVLTQGQQTLAAGQAAVATPFKVAAGAIDEIGRGGNLMDYMRFGSQTGGQPVEAVQPGETEYGRSLNTPTGRGLQKLAGEADWATKLIGSVPSIPLSILTNPVDAAAMLVSMTPAGMVMNNPITRYVLQAIEGKVGTAVARAVEAELHGAVGVGSFSATATAMKGGTPGEIIEAGGEGALTGLAFGAPAAAGSLIPPVAGAVRKGVGEVGDAFRTARRQANLAAVEPQVRRQAIQEAMQDAGVTPTPSMVEPLAQAVEAKQGPQTAKDVHEAILTGWAKTGAEDALTGQPPHQFPPDAPAAAIEAYRFGYTEAKKPTDVPQGTREQPNEPQAAGAGMPGPGADSAGRATDAGPMPSDVVPGKAGGGGPAEAGRAVRGGAGNEPPANLPVAEGVAAVVAGEGKAAGEPAGNVGRGAGAETEIESPKGPPDETQTTPQRTGADHVGQGRSGQQANVDERGGGAGPGPEPTTHQPGTRAPKRGEFSQASVGRWLRKWWDDNPANQRAGRLNEAQADETNTSNLSTRFSGKLPGEVRDYIDKGAPGWRRRQMAFKANDPHGRGEDVLHTLGVDEYFARVDRMVGGNTKDAIENAKGAIGHDPKAAFFAWLHDYGPANGHLSVIDKPNEALDNGHRLTIGNKNFEIKTIDGFKTLVDSDRGVPMTYLAALDALPIDPGSLTKSEAMSGGKDLFGRSLVAPLGNSQGSMFGESAFSAENRAESAKASEESKADKESGRMFGGGSGSALANPGRPLGAPPGSAIKSTRIEPAPLPGGTPKRVSEIVMDLSKDVGQIRFGKPHGRSLGTYYPGSAKTISRFTGDMDTTAHEVAHRMDDLYGIVAQWATPKGYNKAGAKIPQKSPFDKELRAPIFQQSVRDGYSTVQKRAEGVAEYLRAWMVNPDEATANAPKFTAWFEKQVPENVRNRLRAFGDDIRRWAGQSDLARTASNIRTTIEKPTLGEKVGEFKAGDGGFDDWLTRTNAAFNDALAPVHKAVREAKTLRGIADLLPERDPSMLVRLYAGATRKIEDWIQNGPFNARGGKVTGAGGLDWLMEPIKAKNAAEMKKNIADVSAYMVSERVIERVELMKTMHEEAKDHLAQAEQLRKDAAIEPDHDIRAEMLADAKQREADAKKSMARVGYKGPFHRFAQWIAQKAQRFSGAGGGFYSDYLTAQAAVGEAAKDPRFARIKEAARRYRVWSDSVLDYMKAKGRLSSEQVDAIKASNQYFVSMKRVMDDVMQSFGGASGAKRIGSKHEPIARLKGSTREIENPYVSLMQHTMAAIREADRNEILQKFRNLLTRPRDIYQGKPIDLDQIGSKAASGDKNTVPIVVDGKVEHWQFAPGIYKALKGLNEQGPDPLILRIAQMPQRWIKMGVTHFPAFIVRNAIRDAESRAVLSEHGSKPWDVATVWGKDAAKLLDDFHRAGGGNFGHFFGGPEAYRKVLRDAVNEVSGDKRHILTTFPQLLGDKYAEIGRMMEEKGRLAEYRRAFDAAKTKGMDDYNARLYAADAARGLQDFSVAGTVSKQINKYVPFFAPAIRGAMRVIEGVRKNPTGVAARWLTYVASVEMASFAWNRMQGDDGDERDLTADRRDKFWNLKVGPDLWLSIPKPWEMGVASAGIRRLIDQAAGVEHPWEGYAKSAASAGLPVSEWGELLGGFKAPIEVLTNRDLFTGGQIVPPWEEKLDLGLRKGDDRASGAGKVLQSLFGVDARYFDHLIRGMGASVGDAALAASSGDVGRLGMKSTGVLATQAPGQSPDVRFVLDWAAANNKSQKTDFVRLQDALKAYRAEPDAMKRKEISQTINAAAARLRAIIESQKRGE